MYKKLFFALLLMLAIAGIIAGLSALHRPETPEESSSEAEPAVSSLVIVPSKIPERISVEIPPGFTETSSEYYDLYYICDDASVIITGENAVIAPQIEDYMQTVREQYRAAADEFTIVDETALHSNGLSGRAIEFTYAIIGQDVRQDMACITGIFIKDNYIYAVTCKSRLETFSIYRTTFKNLLESVRIADAPSASEIISSQDAASALPQSETVPEIVSTES